jgi:hypothetical protein
MTFTLKGKLIDPTTNKPLSYHTIKIFDKDPFFDIFGDDSLGTCNNELTYVSTDKLSTLQSKILTTMAPLRSGFIEEAKAACVC